MVTISLHAKQVSEEFLHLCFTEEKQHTHLERHEGEQTMTEFFDERVCKR